MHTLISPDFLYWWPSGSPSQWVGQPWPRPFFQPLTQVCLSLWILMLRQCAWQAWQMGLSPHQWQAWQCHLTRPHQVGCQVHHQRASESHSKCLTHCLHCWSFWSYQNWWSTNPSAQLSYGWAEGWETPDYDKWGPEFLSEYRACQLDSAISDWLLCGTIPHFQFDSIALFNILPVNFR